MQQIDGGGLCLISCASGSRKGKECCTPRSQMDINITLTFGGNDGAQQNHNNRSIIIKH